MFEGVARTERNHADNALKYLESKLASKVPDLPRGLARAFLYAMLDLDFEEVAKSTYLEFAQETDDPELKRMFTEQAQSELGHIGIFKSILEVLKAKSYRTSLFCPVCGWKLVPGEEVEGQELICPKCGARFSLELSEGNWKLLRGG